MIKLIKSTFYKEKETKKELCSFITNATQLSFGQECQKFEERFATHQKRKYCIFFNSGSSANFALIQALFNLKILKQSDKAAFSAVTWSTNPMPLIQLGLNIIPVDVELETLNVSSRTLVDVIDRNPLKVFFLTNLLGFCDDIDKIANICKERKIVLIEDNCEALGSVYKNKKLGNFGLASTFSFYVGHHMSTVEGGAVCTDNESLAIMLKLVRAHGWDRNLSLRQQDKIRKKYKVESSFYAQYTFYDLGLNFRPTEINGFLGNRQLNYLNEINKRRNTNFLQLAESLYLQKDKFLRIRYDHMDFVSNFAFPVICRTQKFRDQLIKKCEGKIEIRPIVGGDMTEQPFFRKYVKHLDERFNCTNAKLIHENGLYFGNNPELTEEEIKEIIRIFTT